MLSKCINKVIILLVFLLITGCQKVIEGNLIIKNVNIINVENGNIIEGQDIIIIHNTIAEIIPHNLSTNYSAKTMIDGTNKYVIPGIFDGHTHVNNYKNDLAKFIHYGVTSIFVTGGSTCTNQYYAEMRAMGTQDSLPSPRIFHTSQHFIKQGSHPVKTYANSSWKEGETVFYLKDTLQIERLVKKVSQYPIEGIKLTIEDGPDPPFVERLSQSFISKVQKEAEKHDTRVFVHVSDNEELKMALDAGIYNFVHFTGVDLDFEKDTLLLKKIYGNPINWITTLMLDKSFMYPLYPEWIDKIRKEGVFNIESIEKVNDSTYIKRAHINNALMKDYLKLDTITIKDVVKFQVDDIKRLQKNDVNMVLGTDTGNAFIFPGYSLHEEMQLFELGGMAPKDILKMGTINAAIMLGRDDTLGSIDIGKYADLILLDKNPIENIKNTRSIQMVIKNGKIQKRMKEK